MKTENCTLLKSELTKKIIRFGAGSPNDKEITNLSVSVNKVSTDISDYKPYAPYSDFSIFWPHEFNFGEQDSDRLEEIKTI